MFTDMTTDVQDEDQRTLFNIPAENMGKFEAAVAKLSKKAEKLIGVSFKPFVFGWEMKTLADGREHRVYQVLFNAEVPKLAGWSFVARLDHSNETGTIVRAVPNAPAIPAQYRTAKNTTCDHCGTRRYRRDTFIVFNEETNVFKQVGSTCLKEFLGEDPYKIAALAELLGYAREAAHGYEHYTEVGGDMRWLSVEEWAQATARAVLKHGWVSGKAAYENDSLVSTRSRAWTCYTDGVPATDEEIKLAEDALAWAASLRTKTELNDYEHNILVVADATMIEPRSCGLASSIVGVYYANQQRAKLADVPRKVELGDFKAVIELFSRTDAKYPKIRLQLDNGQPIVLSVSGERAKFPGSVQITDGGSFDNNIWFGRVHKDGTWDRSKHVHGTTMASLTALLTALATDPAGTASAYGKLTGQCCFCARGLDDARSMHVGYGPICAKKFGLPWGEK